MLTYIGAAAGIITSAFDDAVEELATEETRPLATEVYNCALSCDPRLLRACRVPDRLANRTVTLQTSWVTWSVCHSLAGTCSRPALVVAHATSLTKVRAPRCPGCHVFTGLSNAAPSCLRTSSARPVWAT